MEILCRLCGLPNINSINILDGSNDTLKLEIYNLLRIDIHQCDFLPTKVCTSCVTAVKEASAFIHYCHHVQKVLTEKYKAAGEYQNPKNTELVSKTNSSIVPVPLDIEEKKKNAFNKEHAIILEAEHSVFVEESKKLTFDDPLELNSDVASDPLVSEHSTSDNINVNSKSLETSSNILSQNEVESNIEVIQNELAAPRFEISGVPYPFNDSMNVEELPIIKPEAIEIDDCFASDPLEMESNEDSLQSNAEVNGNDISPFNYVLPETTQNIRSAVPASLNCEVQVEENHSSNFPAMSIDNRPDIAEVESKSSKKLLCVTLTRISGGECSQKSARDVASDINDKMHEPSTQFMSNEKDKEANITPTSTRPSRVNRTQNLKTTLLSVLASQKDSPTEGVHVGKKLEGVKKGGQLVNKDAWKNYFQTNSFRRDSNTSGPSVANNNIVVEKSKASIGSTNSDDDDTSSETDPQKLLDYCMQITKQLNLKKYKYVERPRADRLGSEQQVTSDAVQNRSENELTNQSCTTATADSIPAEDDGPKNSLVPNKNRTFLKCGTCGKKFLSKSLYDDHLNMHTGYRPFKCDICSKTYRRRSDLTVHIRVIHARGEFKCSLCDYVATFEGKLKVHVKTSHEKPFCCNECNYRCGAKKRMAEHISNKHQNVESNRLEVCELCGGAFKGKLSLRAHQQQVHFPEPQVCSTCGKYCVNQSVYKNHMLQCGKERIRYTCDMCGRTYSKKAVLKEHMNKHLNIKPYECKVCNKQFFLRVRLLTHMAVHRAPTFQCEVCCKSFNRKDNMKSHMKKHFENKGM